MRRNRLVALVIASRPRCYRRRRVPLSICRRPQGALPVQLAARRISARFQIRDSRRAVFLLEREHLDERNARGVAGIANDCGVASRRKRSHDRGVEVRRRRNATRDDRRSQPIPRSDGTIPDSTRLTIDSPLSGVIPRLSRMIPTRLRSIPPGRGETLPGHS